MVRLDREVVMVQSNDIRAGEREVWELPQRPSGHQPSAAYRRRSRRCRHSLSAKVGGLVKQTWLRALGLRVSGLGSIISETRSRVFEFRVQGFLSS